MTVAAAPTRSSPATPPAASSASRCSRTGSRSARSSPGRGPGSARSRRSRSPSPPTAPRLLDRLAAGERRRTALARRARRRRAGRAFARSRWSTRSGARRRHTGDGCIAHAGRPRRRRLQRPGQHDGLGGGLAGDGARLRGRRGAARRRLLAALEAAEAAGGDVRGRQSAALLVGPAARASSGGPTVELRVEDHPDPLAELRAPARPRTTPTRSPTAPTRSPARAATSSPRGFTRGRGRGPRQGRARFWAGLGIAAGGDLDGGPSGCGPRSTQTTAGAHSLASPGVAPAADAVREALSVAPESDA